MRNNNLFLKGGNMFTTNMHRVLLLGLLLTATLSFTGCGMPTYSESSSGFVDTGSRPTAAVGSTQYYPVNPDGTIVLPKGQAVPVQPGAMYPVTLNPGVTTTPNNGLTLNSPGVTNTGDRITYHNETQRSSVVEGAMAFDLISDGTWKLVDAAGRFVCMVSPKGGKHSCPIWAFWR